MSKAELDLTKLWTEAEFLALGETTDRIELIDGRLRVTPHANWDHSEIGYLLKTALRPAAKAGNLHIAENVNVRLASGRLVIPDLVVARRRGRVVTDACGVVLVAEITSPSNAAYDRVQKKDLYAAARIDWYLLVEPDMSDYQSVTLTLLRLDGERYLEFAVAKHGETLISDHPFPIEIRTEDLVES